MGTVTQHRQDARAGLARLRDLQETQGVYPAYPIQRESALILLQIKCDGQVSPPPYSSRLSVGLILRRP